MSRCCFRVISERYLTSEINFVRWNPKYDLLAIATKRGDVILQRLFWKKAWQLSSQMALDGNASITAMSWSPNGKYLAVAYFGIEKVVFVEIESGRVVDEIGRGGVDGGDGGDVGDVQQRSNDSSVVVSKWSDLNCDSKNTDPCPSTNLLWFDEGDNLLLPLPPVEKSRSTSVTVSTTDPFLIGCESEASNRLSVFIIGDGGCRLRTFLNGIFRVADLNISKFVENNASTVFPAAIDLVDSSDRMGIAYLVSGSELRFGVFDSPLSSMPWDYWIRISRRVSYLVSGLRYVESMLEKILDSWDDSLGDLETKLTKYALSKGKSSETVGDDFLQMLTFGIASPELEHFVTHTLSDKVLKKLSSSIDNSYQNLFSLLGVNLDCAVSSLYHHLTALQHLAPADENDTAMWNEAIEAVGSLSMTVTRLHDMAEAEAASTGLFVRWLHRCLLMISDENLNPNLCSFSNDEVDVLSKYIRRNFCKSIIDNNSVDTDASAGQCFGLDKVGRLLKNDHDVADAYGARGNVVLRCRHSEGASLAKCTTTVRHCIKDILERLTSNFSRRFSLIGSSCCCSEFSGSLNNIAVAYDSKKQRFRVTFFREGELDNLVISEFDDRSASLVFSWKLISPVGVDRVVLSFDLYNSATVTTLIRERKGEDTDWKYILYQIDAPSLRTVSAPAKGDELSEGGCPRETISVPWDLMKNQRLHDGQFCLVSVSGTRKVGCAIFTCRTRLKLLEMEPDDDATVQSGVLDEDTSNAAMDTEQD